MTRHGVSFAEFKRSVMAVAKVMGVAYLVPGDNDLYVAWESHTPVNAVVDSLSAHAHDLGEAGA